MVVCVQAATAIREAGMQDAAKLDYAATLGHRRDTHRTT